MDASNLISIIDSELEKATPTGAKLEGAVPTTFCSLWPTALPVLQVVIGLVAWMPWFPATTVGVLQGLINVGQALYTQGCVTVSTQEE